MRNLLNNIKNKVTNRKQQIKAALITLYLSIGIATPVFAAPNVAENASRWFLDQIFWVVLAATVIGALVAATKKATTALVTTIIIGGVVAFLCKSPETISTIGDVIGRAITGG